MRRTKSGETSNSGSGGGSQCSVLTDVLHLRYHSPFAKNHLFTNLEYQFAKEFLMITGKSLKRLPQPLPGNNDRQSVPPIFCESPVPRPG
jgi:hypothetical protein